MPNLLVNDSFSSDELSLIKIKAERMRSKGLNSMKTKCPSCSEERKKSSDPCLSIINDSDGFGVKCHHCGKTSKIFFKQNRKFKILREDKVKTKRVNMTKLTEEEIDYLFKRGITQKTIRKADLFHAEAYFPSSGRKKNAIGFPSYYPGEKDPAYIQYRAIDSKEFISESGLTPIFFNLQSIQGARKVVITEGQIDTLSFMEAGASSVISVPNGTTISQEEKEYYEENGEFLKDKKLNLKYLDRCIDLFDSVQEIIIATDSDIPGLKLREELARRLGKERCTYIEFPEDCKDANDVLTKYGQQGLIKCGKNAKKFPIDGVLLMSDLKKKVNKNYAQGIDPGVKAGVSSAMDKIVRFRTGMLYVLTGIPKSGKSNFARQIYCNLAANHGWKMGIFSAEEQPYDESFIPDLIEQYTGLPFYHHERKIPEKVLENAYDFIENHFFFINMDEGAVSIENIIEKSKALIKDHGINMISIDPWTALESQSGFRRREDQFLRDNLNALRVFRKKYDIASFIVTHPITMREKDDKKKRPTMYDISGGSQWFNHMDVGMVVDRNFDKGTTSLYVDAVRNKHIGQQNESCDFYFDIMNNRYTDAYTRPDEGYEE